MINMPGGPEMMVILLVALVVLGPQQLPKAMRTLGNVMAEIRKVSNGFQNEMRAAMDSITDDGSSKPQSATMAAAHPVDAVATESPVIEATGATEVVARNDGTHAGTSDTSSGNADGDATGGSASDAPAAAARPVISPADRAAG
jgi:Tat protein translocase TatB subunit